MSNFLNENFSLKDKGTSNAVGNINSPRHRWYSYKEGFSPFLVEKAIQSTNLSKNDIILDPFNGSGTTTLTSSLFNVNSIGIEVNPFTSFLSSAKLDNVDLSLIDKYNDVICNGFAEGARSHLFNYSTFTSNSANEKWLFNDAVLSTYEGGYKNLDLLPLEYRSIFKLALISSAMENCNARRDGKCLRYKDSWESINYSQESFILAFQSIIANIKEDIEKFPVNKQAGLILGDSRKILTNASVPDFKLCITSPPYLNTFDYTDIYRPELFLGRFVFNNIDLYQLRLRTLRSHVQAKWESPKESDFGPLYRDVLKLISADSSKLMDPKIPMMIQAYFEDMLNVLSLLRKKAQKSATLWLVISNSAYAGYEVPVDLILGDIGAKAGWYLKEIGVLRYLNKRKTKHSPEVTKLRESVVIFSTDKR